MKNSKNYVSLEGLAGNDPKITEFENGKVARVSIAVKDPYINKFGEPASRTFWFNLVFWNEKAILADKIKKGSACSVEGRLSSQSFTGKDGATVYTTEVIVADLKLKAKSTKVA